MSDDARKGNQSLISLVQRFRDTRVLVIGDAMLDTYLEGTATRLCSEGPVPVVARTAEYRLPGGAANSAANLQALGADVRFLSVIGHDLAGSLFCSMLAGYGVSAAWLVEDEAVTTQHKLRIIADGQYVVRFDEGGVLGENGVYQRALLESLDELYAWCDVVVVSDYRYGVLFPQLVQRLGTLQAEQPKVLVVDSKALEGFRQLKATVLTPNYQEACAFLARVGEDADMAIASSSAESSMNEQVASVGARLLRLLPCEYLVLTLGERGVCLFDRAGQVTFLPAHPVAHANDVGAGDSFTSALALALGVGADIDDAACIGIDAASIAVSAPRTAVVTVGELLQRVSLRAYTAQSGISVRTVPIDAFLLAGQLEAQRQEGRTIVFTSGIFDILHAGHVQFLRQARALGDVLVVGLNSDRSAHRLKGAGHPVNSARDRAALVAALDMVDHVVVFDEDVPLEILRTLRPHIHAKGGDYTDAALPEARVMREIGGQVMILPLAGQQYGSPYVDGSGEAYVTSENASHANTYGHAPLSSMPGGEHD